jgi:hypothetical protein
MKPFNHTNATSLAEIKIALADSKTDLIAGGTDLLGTLKDNVVYFSKVFAAVEGEVRVLFFGAESGIGARTPVASPEF